MSIEVEVANEQDLLPIDEARLADAAQRVLSGEGVSNATISLAVVGDKAMHELNRRYLGHDYPTDVLSFVLEQSAERLEGEVIVSADTAIATAVRYGWSPIEELLLYVIHGCLHLSGYDDQTDDARTAMRQRERIYLAELGIEAPHDESSNLKSEI